jgi:hypothetical protein
MPFIYEVNGQRVQFDKEPTDKDIDEAARSLGVAKPESRQPKPVEGSGGAAFGVYRQAGPRPESQQDREAAKEMAPQTVRGIVTGTLGGVSDVLNLPGQLYGAATNQPSPYTVPLGSEEWNQMLPGRVDTPHANLARMGGQALAPAPIAQVAKGAVELGKGTYNFGKGFARGIAYPEGASPNTALAPIRPTYVPHEQVNEFMAGQRPASTLTEMPTAPLYENKPVANWAYGMSPQNQAGQKLVPYAGRTAEGIGEQIGSGYRTNPLNAAIDIGTTLATGVPAPLTAIARSAPAIAARQLQKATQFEPGFGAARQAALATEGRAGLEASMPPTQNLLPAPGPVQPTMYASQSGQVTGAGGTALPTQASGQPVTQPATNPAQFSQQVAASKIQPVQPTGVNPTQQADWAKRSGGGYTPPAQQAPMPTSVPVAPTELPTETLQVTPPKTQAPAVTSTVEDLLSKNRQLTKEEQKINIKAAKDTAKGIEVKKEPVHPEVERIAKEAEQSTSEFIKSLNLDTLDEAQKQATKVSLLEEQRKLQSAIRDNRISKVYSNDEIEKLMKRYHAVDKAVTTIQNEQVHKSNKARWEKNQADIAEKQAEKEAKKVSKKKAPDNVSQMLIEDTSGPKTFPSKEAFEKESIFSTLKDEPHTGSYIQGDKIIHVEKIDYGTMPKDVTKDFQQTKTYATDKSGNRVPIGKTWTDLDPEPLGARVRNILDRNKGKKK